MHKAEHSVKRRGLLNNELIGHEHFVNLILWSQKILGKPDLVK